MQAHISRGEGILMTIDLMTSQANSMSCSNTLINDIMQSNTSRRHELHRLDVPPEHVLRFPEAEAAHERILRK